MLIIYFLNFCGHYILSNRKITFLGFGGHTQHCSGVSLVLNSEIIPGRLRKPVGGYWGLNPVWLHARQTSNSLCYHSSSGNKNILRTICYDREKYIGYNDSMIHSFHQMFIHAYSMVGLQLDPYVTYVINNLSSNLVWGEAKYSARCHKI